MLNSCSPNVCVVNIDNGFGAAYVAAMMVKQGTGNREQATAGAEDGRAPVASLPHR